MDRAKMLGTAVLWICGTLLTGCYKSHPEDIQAWVKPYETNVTADRYVVQPPDELELRCAQVPEVNMQRQRVRPDGKISFEVLGEFDGRRQDPRGDLRRGREADQRTVHPAGRARRRCPNRCFCQPRLLYCRTGHAAGTEKLHGARQHLDSDQRGSAQLDGLAETDPGGPACGPGRRASLSSSKSTTRRWSSTAIRARTSCCRKAISSTSRRPFSRRSAWFSKNSSRRSPGPSTGRISSRIRPERHKAATVPMVAVSIDEKGNPTRAECHV